MLKDKKFIHSINFTMQLDCKNDTENLKLTEIFCEEVLDKFIKSEDEEFADVVSEIIDKYDEKYCGWKIAEDIEEYITDAINEHTQGYYRISEAISDAFRLYLWDIIEANKKVIIFNVLINTTGHATKLKWLNDIAENITADKKYRECYLYKFRTLKDMIDLANDYIKYEEQSIKDWDGEGNYIGEYTKNWSWGNKDNE